MLSRCFLAAVSALIMAGCCTAFQPEKVRISNTTYARDSVKPFVDSGELPGAICVFYNNGLQETAIEGWASVEKKIPMSMDSMFMQCSQTKGFCGVTVAILVEEGKLSLDDPVSKYLPEFKELKVAVKDEKGKVTIVPAKTVVTVRMLVNHTSGLPFEPPSKSKKGWPSMPLREAAREAAANPLRFEPGTKVGYSNSGIDVAATIVQEITGKPWEVFLKERVLDPLDMKDSTFCPTDEQLARSISLYKVAPGKKAVFRAFHPAMPLPHNGPGVHPSAGAGLWTTANDQLKFYKMLMNLGAGDNGVRILKEETVKNLLATRTSLTKTGNYSMGLGVSNDGWFGHGGAFGTSCWVNWEKRQLRLLVVQINGPRPWEKRWHNASGEFFKATIDAAEASAHTGRFQ